MIKKVEVFAARLQLKEPFVISYVHLDDMPTILTRIETDKGVVGWGEAVPDQNVTGETWESTYHVIKHVLAPLLINEDPFAVERIHKKFNEKIDGVPSAKAALDIALYDLMGKITGQPVYQLIGGKAHKELQVPRVISIKSPEEMAKDASEFVASGFRNIKIKVGTNAELDIARIRAVREAIGDEVQLRVDANQGWNRMETLKVIRETIACHVDWYEQPVKAHDLRALKEIRALSPCSIMVDEGVHNIYDLVDVIEMRAADMLNIKLMKSGGIYPALALASLAEAAEMPCQVGSMVESAIATMAGAHLAISKSIIHTNEMVGPLMFVKDVANVTYDKDILQLSHKAGLGIEVDEQYVKEITCFSCEIK
ncbi:dipeptide epimerase [Lysinibacillus sphaericus]|uniref:Dipeptide epimerase n=3 Tax=Lysinibacillus TaxID=400634 RepID=B1HQG6_LYSSC|nr:MULTISPECIES: dipeptide epimerase [Lysinibacillus]MBE5085100.1 dipeptide epimerase [Bacillus thuringiensis]ACA39113.1 Chloromuconate cycloisomerase [Lysinibacillus sphaericus C3-41]EWH34581.1 mandelate racemase [Lysinibacillus sphaericus CBAM5]MCS1398336.1 dipeptide epimerase [Lysinibacillus sp. PB211]MDR0158365.1 dipeptide epimerase [Lysinibacillus sphaericus]